MSWKEKVPPKRASQFKEDPEQQRIFDDLRRKYAFAIVYLLVKNVQQSELKKYFDQEDNRARYEGVKKFRQDILDARPRAKLYVDKPFYLSIKIERVETVNKQVACDNVEQFMEVDVPVPQTTLAVGGCIFKQTTSVVTSQKELDVYVDTIGKIIESEKIWNDPAMQQFDFDGKEELYSQKKKKSANKSQEKKCEEKKYEYEDE